MNYRIKTLLAMATAVALGCGLAEATIAPSVAVVNSPGAWSYNASLTSGLLQAGDGFTIFDFGGYIAGSIVAPVNWTGVASPSGSPYGPDINSDSPFDFNLTFTYTGPTVLQTIGAQTFTGFGATTTVRLTSFDGWASRDHQPDGNVGTVHTDLILVPVPEVSTTVAVLGGLVFLGAVALRRKSRRA